eukprot:350235-Chlamydomonas_euryale.AAC.2
MICCPLHTGHSTLGTPHWARTCETSCADIPFAMPPLLAPPALESMLLHPYLGILPASGHLSVLPFIPSPPSRTPASPMHPSQGCTCLLPSLSPNHYTSARILTPHPHTHAHRPLVLGRRDSARGEEYCIASEDCAFGPIGFTRVRDVQPGEMVIISQDGKLHSRQVKRGRPYTRVCVVLGGGSPEALRVRHKSCARPFETFV